MLRSPLFLEFFLCYPHPVNKKTTRKLVMTTRKSFSIRWLLAAVCDRKPESPVIEVEHIQSGSSRRVSSLEEARQWMQEANELRE